MMRQNLLIVFTIFIVFPGCWCNDSGPDLDTLVSNIDSVEFENERTIYLLAKEWGLAGNHEQLSIYSSNSPDTIIIHTSKAYFKKAGNDSLVVYAPESLIPDDIRSNIGNVKVNLIGLRSYDEIQDYDARYREYGLIKIYALEKQV